MTLNGVYFIPFILLVLLVTLLIQVCGKKCRKNPARVQALALLLFSYVFIALNSIVFCLILLATSFFTYFSAIYLYKRNRNRKTVLTVTIVILILELVYFKYTNFFLSSFLAVCGKDSIVLNIILPLGISFYILTAIGYVIDIYKRKYDADKSFINVALMLAFFPKVISGPIVRGDDFLGQLKQYQGIQKDKLLSGIQIFAFGLFKKIVLADRLGVFVADVYGAPGAFHTGTVLFAVLSYSLQIYFDFSGYSDMAVGASRMLGIEVPRNFNLPYLAKNASDFWARWHISLSSWLRDYLYFPLGGSRNGTARTYINLFVVMLISGLWHGASFTFVIWGALHGLYSCISKLIYKRLGRKIDGNKVLRAISVFINFMVVSLLWIPFRASSVSNAIAVIKSGFTTHPGIVQPYTWSMLALLVFICAVVIAGIKSKRDDMKSVNGFYPLLDLSKISHQTVFFVFVGITVILGYYGNTAFIYAAF